MTKVVNLKGEKVVKENSVLTKVPKAPVYLCSDSKKYFERNAKILIDAKILKKRHLEALAILADNLAQKEWAIREIRRKNREKMGKGFIQKFTSGAQNISVEITLRNTAEKRILECLSLFGMDPKSEKANSTKDASQLEFGFEELKRALTN